MWLGANREDLREESPDLSDADLTVLAARRYKGLTSEEKQVSRRLTTQLSWRLTTQLSCYCHKRVTYIVGDSLIGM